MLDYALSEPNRFQYDIANFIGQKNYPCVPALKSFEQGEYMIGVYQGAMGSGGSSQALLDDLIAFGQKQKSSGSVYMSFWAIFPESPEMNEDQFESEMWRELSHACALQDPAHVWDPNFSSNPSDQKFCPSFGGDAFFIVGLHPNSSRLARRFRHTAIVFNLYEQFEELTRMGKYESTVKANRAREMKFQGSLNPMVEKHGDKWEAIQFSGKNNPDDWKCPFHHGARPEV